MDNHPLLQSLHRYQAHGLVFESEIELPELPSAPSRSSDSSVSVTISIGAVAPRLEGSTREGVRFALGPNSFHLRVDGVARYLARNGTSIVIDPEPSAPLDRVRLFLYGSVFAALLLQRGAIALHASAVTDGRHAYLFAGRSGIGKSTTAHRLVASGWKLLSDDVTAVRTDSGVAWALPALAQQKLWSDVLHEENLGTDELQPVSPRLQKFYLEHPEAFCREPMPIRKIFLLEHHNQPTYETQPVEGGKKLKALQPHVYRRNFLADMVSPSRFFQGWMELANAVEVHSAKRPLSKYRRDLLDRWLSEITRP